MPSDVAVDIERCICARECVRVAPEVFEIDEDEMVSTVAGDVTAVDPESLLLAAASCPVRAITVRDK